MSYPELVQMTESEIYSGARLRHIHSELEGLRLESFMSTDDIADNEAGLYSIVDRINPLLPQCLPEFRSESYKIRFLCDAARNTPWAFLPVFQLTTQKCTHNWLVAALRGSLPLPMELKPTQSISSSHIASTFHEVWEAP